MKRFSIKTMAVALFGLCLSACGGVDQSDPESVAEAAMECYIKDDCEGMIKLVDPSNTSKINELTRRAEFAKQNAGEPTSTNRSAKFDTLVYSSIYPNEASAYYSYTFTDKRGEENTWKMEVVLEKKDSKWWLDGIK